MPRAILAALLVTVICAVPSSARVGSGKIAFVTEDGLYTINPNGTGRTLLKSDENSVNSYGFFSPRWSPDGSRIAFVDYRAFEEMRLIVMNADGSNSHVIASATSIGLSRQPWSPDGSRIAWGPAPVTFSRGDVYTAHALGGDVRRLTFGGRATEPPSWSPAGSRLVYPGGGGLLVIGADGSGETPITSAPGYTPTWSPSGEWIAFIGRGLTAVRPDGSELHTVTPGPSGYTSLAPSPTWSPDGSRIAFGAVRYIPRVEYREDVYVVGWNGSNLKRLNPPGGSAWAPAWSPDGARVLFQGSSGRLLATNADGTCPRDFGSGAHHSSSWYDISSSWQPIPNGPPLGRQRCHAISVYGSLAKQTPAAVVIDARVMNVGADPVTKVTLEVPATHGVGAAALSRRCTVRRGKATCRVPLLKPGESRAFSIRLEARRVRRTGRTRLSATIRADAFERLLLSGREETSLTLFLSKCTARDRGGGTLRGTSTADRICGRRGADRIYPGPGNDVVRAGDGNDVVFATDGWRDRISCGRGNDRVKADRGDRISRDCEHVGRP